MRGLGSKAWHLLSSIGLAHTGFAPIQTRHQSLASLTTTLSSFYTDSISILLFVAFSFKLVHFHPSLGGRLMGHDKHVERDASSPQTTRDETSAA
ncbi:hypothetical protein WG66_016667 [Moniliophthora roreri]|nr:hypothetical protein WG66_016667 [Moniliophthora roreri]